MLLEYERVPLARRPPFLFRQRDLGESNELVRLQVSSGRREIESSTAHVHVVEVPDARLIPVLLGELDGGHGGIRRHPLMQVRHVAEPLLGAAALPLHYVVTGSVSRGIRPLRREECRVDRQVDPGDAVDLLEGVPMRLRETSGGRVPLDRTEAGRRLEDVVADGRQVRTPRLDHPETICRSGTLEYAEQRRADPATPHVLSDLYFDEGRRRALLRLPLVNASTNDPSVHARKKESFRVEAVEEEGQKFLRRRTEVIGSQNFAFHLVPHGNHFGEVVAALALESRRHRKFVDGQPVENLGAHGSSSGVVIVTRIRAADQFSQPVASVASPFRVGKRVYDRLMRDPSVR